MSKKSAILFLSPTQATDPAIKASAGGSQILTRVMGPHRSVLLREAVERLAPRPGQWVVDATVGDGGHAEAILERLGPHGRLIGLDKDARAIERAGHRLERFGGSAVLVNEDFQNLAVILGDLGTDRVQGLLADLGVSSPQLDEPERGFSFRTEGPLDMRMDVRQSLTAAEVVNRAPRPELEKILREFGEERFARRIAERITAERSRFKIKTTRELAAIVERAVPSSYRHGRIHPATRTFQAIRIAVNGEVQALERFLNEAVHWLDRGARVVIISFHSLEDRVVKKAFRDWEQRGIGRVLTRKPITPADAEKEANPRSRSAKMRVFETGGGSSS